MLRRVLPLLTLVLATSRRVRAACWDYAPSSIEQAFCTPSVRLRRRVRRLRCRGCRGARALHATGHATRSRHAARRLSLRLPRRSSRRSSRDGARDGRTTSRARSRRRDCGYGDARSRDVGTRHRPVLPNVGARSGRGPRVGACAAHRPYAAAASANASAARATHAAHHWARPVVPGVASRTSSPARSSRRDRLARVRVRAVRTC